MDRRSMQRRRPARTSRRPPRARERHVARALAAWLCAACGAGERAGQPGDGSAGAGASAPSIAEAQPDGDRADAGAGSSAGSSAEVPPIPRQEPSFPDAAPPASEPRSGIVIVDRRVVIDGEPLLIRGVCWNPVPAGGSHPAQLDFAGFAQSDVGLMADLGVNVVRTYEPLLDSAVLDRLWQSQIYVINSVYPYGGAAPEAAVERVRAVAGHPAILMWAIGNEWNYNGLYAGLSPSDAVARLNDVAALIKAEDPSHPVTTIYGELPSAETLAALPNVDVWGLNVYRGLGFDTLFEDWRALSDKPMFLAEYGADAYNAGVAAYDPESHALAVSSLTRELQQNAAALSESGVALGGTVFELADEWWKDAAGSAAQQDVGGSAPGGGPYPDGVFNEEWWGLVDMQRQPRPAYESLRAIFLGSGR